MTTTTTMVQKTYTSEYEVRSLFNELEARDFFKGFPMPSWTRQNKDRSIEVKYLVFGPKNEETRSTFDISLFYVKDGGLSFFDRAEVCETRKTIEK